MPATSHCRTTAPRDGAGDWHLQPPTRAMERKVQAAASGLESTAEGWRAQQSFKLLSILSRLGEVSISLMGTPAILQNEMALKIYGQSHRFCPRHAHLVL